MANKMLIESDAHQTRIAVLEDDRPTEIFVERHRRRGLVGNVYKGRVNRVLPGMQAAFVDIGLGRDAFLYVSDVTDNLAALEDLEPAEPAPEAPIDALDDEVANGDGVASAPPIYSIDELLKVGQEVLVQVTKDPLANKGARVTTHITLPGRYLVL